MTPITDREIDDFRRLEESLWRAEPAVREEILSTEFTEFCRFGHVYDREHLIESSNGHVEVAFPFEAFRVEKLAEEVVLVTYENTVTTAGVSQRARRSSIWVLDAERWKLRFQQATTLPGSG